MFKLVVFSFLFVTAVHAEELNLAVAANFTSAMEKIKSEFEQSTKHKLLISSGSSGKLFAQIKEKAPFDLFFSADNQFTQKMIDEKLVLNEGRLIYAQGKLVLYSKNKKFSKNFHVKDLGKMDFKYMALANPDLAPYGKAALEVLSKLALVEKLHLKMVKGQNIAETFHYLSTNNSELGFVALSQVMKEKKENYYVVPQEYYSPLLQEAVIVATSKKVTAAKEFLAFVQSKKELIRSLGHE